jgi:hypothetical protein
MRKIEENFIMDYYANIVWFVVFRFLVNYLILIRLWDLEGFEKWMENNQPTDSVG